jgi:2-(3-amino-3-carboxypropyl)histidine synthase|tara:strand:+ start:251 stop:880 length:630 start_codon:yes stop_codon:yes gene_type:complete
MKTVFIEAKYEGKVELSREVIDKLPNKVGLVSTVQFIDKLSLLKNQFKKNNKKIIIAGQVLGCEFSKAEKIKNKVDCFLYVGTGGFHPLGLAYTINKPVFVYNPLTGVLDKISEKEVLVYKKRRKGAYLKFLSAKNVGVLVSTKPGQNQMNNALSLKNKLKDKNCYIFIADTIDLNELENFPFIEAWVNTACPRMVEDKVGMINIDEIM